MLWHTRSQGLLLWLGTRYDSGYSYGRTPKGKTSMSRNHRRMPTRTWERLREETFNRDQWRCRQCGKAGALECHHTIPLETWPDQPWTIDGLLTLCRDCHIAIHRRILSEAEREWVDFLDELE